MSIKKTTLLQVAFVISRDDQMVLLHPGDKVSVKGISIEAVPTYNIHITISAFNLLHSLRQIINIRSLWENA